MQEKPKTDSGARPKQKVQKSASIATDMDHSTRPQIEVDKENKVIYLCMLYLYLFEKNNPENFLSICTCYLDKLFENILSSAKTIV